MLRIALLLLSTQLLSTNADSLDALKRDLQSIVDAEAIKYNCTFSISIKGPTLNDGGAINSYSSGVDASARFAWGSITKMWTGASIMQLVAAGSLQLDQKIAPLVDAQLAVMKKNNFPGMEKFSKLSDLYGDQVETVTLHNLLAMQSGIPDFDTANPSRYGPDLDPFRATVYSHPTEDFLEPTLMSEPWVATHNLTHTPGEGFHYSSTNFGLLGLILAHHAGVADYRHFNQSAFLPSNLAHAAASIAWAGTGSPRDHGVVDGFDRTDYNGQDPKKNPAGVNVGLVNGVFAGWSAADFVGPPSAVAELGYALWGKEGKLVPTKYRDMMVPNLKSRDFETSFYGLAAQNVGLMGITGGRGDFAVAYGHLGATYGYDSIFAYNPTLDVGIAVATNIETPQQTQPSDAFCLVFNRVKNYLQNERVQTCTYTTGSYYGGSCKCR